LVEFEFVEIEGKEK